jgi:hypothetical protein
LAGTAATEEHRGDAAQWLNAPPHGITNDPKSSVAVIGDPDRCPHPRVDAALAAIEAVGEVVEAQRLPRLRRDGPTPDRLLTPNSFAPHASRTDHATFISAAATATVP